MVIHGFLWRPPVPLPHRTKPVDSCGKLYAPVLGIDQSLLRLRDLLSIKSRQAQFGTEVAYAFKLRSRCLCHFVGRHIWKKQIRVTGFNRIVVELSKDAIPTFTVNSCNVACIKIPLTDVRFDDLRGDALDEFYIACLKRGVDHFLGGFPEAVAAIQEGIESFRAAGYTNHWVEKKRRIRELGFDASLSCHMTHDKFALRLLLKRGARTVYDQEIFVSDPDEIAFAHRFKDVIAADGKILVVDRFKKPLLMLSPEDVEANQSL